MKPFQAILLGVFGVLALVAVFVIASFTGRGGESVGTVVIWGTIPESEVESVMSPVQRETHALDRVSYEEFPEAGFIDGLVQAIAAGRGPDLIIFPSDRIIKDADKLTPISYSTLSRRDFQDSFVEAGENFLLPEGILGIPFYIDPYVMYWNRTLYTEAGIATPPVYWDEFALLAGQLTKKTEAGTVTQSTIALGGWENIAHAKEILVSMIAGLGNPVVERDEAGVPQVVMAREVPGRDTTPAQAGLRFFTSFADPAQSIFSWSRARPLDRDAFLAGTLATYFGPASEATSIREANPNLNFDAAAYPLIRGGSVAVPARLYALAVPNGAKNPVGAASTALLLTGETGQRALMAASGLPSVRRDILAAAPSDPYAVIFRNAALNAFTFLDPDPAATDGALEGMVEDVTSGRLRINEAVRSGDDALRAILRMQ